MCPVCGTHVEVKGGRGTKAAELEKPGLLALRSTKIHHSETVGSPLALLFGGNLG
jgi:hypothetical protein